MGIIDPLTDHGGIAAYSGHNFYFAEQGSDKPIQSFEIKENQIIYAITCPDSPPDRLAKHEAELSFMNDYFKRMGRVYVRAQCISVCCVFMYVLQLVCLVRA